MVIQSSLMIYSFMAKQKAEHDANLRSVLTRAREKGIRLNPDKVEICLEEVRYFGHIIGSEGRKS